MIIPHEILLEFIGKYGKEYGSIYYDDSSLSPKLKDYET